MKRRYKVTKEQLEMVVESLVSDNSLVENKEGVLEEGIFDRLRMKFKAKVEAFLDKLSQSDDPEVQDALATVKATASKVDAEDVPTEEIEANNEVMEAILSMGNLINESVKGKMSKVDRAINRVKEIGGWGTAGAAFVTAVGVLLKAAIGAGMYTLGLPVGLVVMIMLAILVPGAVIGGSATNKRTRDKTGDIRY
tara:strand:- start:355 stop:939 length:585 start_codon:yes stop_codon:yes gene_type:complete